VPVTELRSCAVCNSAESRLRFTAGDRLYHTTTKLFRVVECAGCGLLRLDPPPPAAELGSYYPANYWFAPDKSAAGSLEETWRRLVLRDHVRFVARALADISAAGPVLDVGCGGGLFLGMLRERGHRVIGLDSSSDAARVAWQRNGVPAIQASLEDAPFPPSSCAAITMFHVLEHLYDVRPYLRAARCLLAPGGRLIVQVPNAGCWQYRLLGRAWNGLDVPRHLYDFRAADLEKLLAVCGFEVVQRKHFSLRDNPAGMASSLAPGLDPMARRVRGVAEGAGAKLAKDLVYLGLLLASLPFTILEAACGAGSTVMIEARVHP
jgi:SAM-dependent methyltransferase